jgi:tetratricopeptide (TPR) repeat protein
MLKIFLTVSFLLCFSALAQDDIFDLEKGAVTKAPEKVISAESLKTLLTSGEYAKFRDDLAVLKRKTPEKLNETAIRRLNLQFQLEVGAYKEALEDLKKTPFVDGDMAHYLTAIVQIRNGLHKEARITAEEGLKSYPKAHSLIYILNKVASLTGDIALDDANWQVVKDLYSASKSGKEGTAEQIAFIGLSIQQRSPQKSYTLLQRAYKKDETLVDVFSWAGYHCAEKYEWEFALEEFSKALKVNPNHAEAKAGMAYVLLEKGDYQRARELIAESLAVNPNCSEAIQLLAAIQLVDDRKSEVMRLLKFALESNPNDLEILAQLAAAYHQESRFEKRDELIVQTLAINPLYGKVYLAIAESCENLRQFPEAVEWAEKAIALNSRDWEGYYVSGMNLLRLGEETRGYKTLDKAFSLNGFNIWARNILTLLDRDFKKKEYVQFETKHFLIKLHRSEAEILIPYIREVVEAAYEKYTKKYEIEPIGPKSTMARFFYLCLITMTTFLLVQSDCRDSALLGHVLDR